MRVRAGGSTLGGAAQGASPSTFSLEAIAPAILLLVAREREKEREGKIIVTFSTLFAHQSRRGSEPIAAQ